MGNRDVRNKETKKPKKDAKKRQPAALEIISTPPVEVEVVRKRRKREEGEE
jgi:hypothetical protein